MRVKLLPTYLQPRGSEAVVEVRVELVPQHPVVQHQGGRRGLLDILGPGAAPEMMAAETTGGEGRRKHGGWSMCECECE